MVGERAIQLRVVRPIFRALPFLAPVAGQAADANFKSQIRISHIQQRLGWRLLRSFAAAASSL